MRSLLQCPDVPIGTLNPVPCTVTMTVPKDIPGPAYFYYKLTNFYQNHRRYVSSRSDLQLSGMPPVTVGGIAECTPLQSVNGSQAPADMYLPCGLVANSFFTDTFSLQDQATLQNVAWRRDQISWASDRDKKFKNMTQAYIDAHPGISLRVPPGLEGLAAPNQQFNVENEDFIVWMRVAGLPTFRKLYARIPAGLPQGVYNVNIGIKYSTQLFGGSKSVVVTSTSFIGGYNPFLGIAYIVVGGLCLLLAIVFFVVNLVKPRQLGDPSLLSWNKQGTTVSVIAAGPVGGEI